MPSKEINCELSSNCDTFYRSYNLYWQARKVPLRGRFHEKSQTEPDSRLSQGLKSETFVSAEFLAQMDFTKGGSAETSLKLWPQLFNLISYI